MQKFSSNPKEIVVSFSRNFDLIRNLIYREVAGRYKGSVFGILWSLITPVFMLAVYTFVFSVVFKARWNVESESRVEFALVLFAGLLVFNLLAECVSRAPNLVLMNVNYVKKVVFPLEILPWVSLGGALFHFFVGLMVWFAAYAFLIGCPHWTIILLPFVIIPFVIFVMGLSWALAAIGVYLRDVGQITGMLIQVLMFLTPVFYPVSALPENLQRLIIFNPLALPIEMIRDVIYWGRIPSVTQWFVGLMVAVVTCITGFLCFQKMRKGFADVI